MNPRDVTNNPRDLNLARSRRPVDRWRQRRIQLTETAIDLLAIAGGFAALWLYFFCR